MLHVPQTTTATKDSFPTSSGKISAWLKKLPLANMAFVTSEFYQAVCDLNRLKIPASRRIAIMEMLNPTAHLVLNYLHKNLVARTFPLPAKSRTTIHLAQELLNEIAISYKHVLIELLPEVGMLNKGKIRLAIHRAIRYQTQYFVKLTQVYYREPDEFWGDIHTLYLAAQENNLHLTALKDTTLSDKKAKCSIEEAYVLLNILSLSKPERLRQGEVNQLNSYLERHLNACLISDSPLPDVNNGVHIIDTNSNEPAVYRRQDDIDPADQLIFLNLRDLVKRIRLETSGKADSVLIKEGAALRLDFAKRLIINWSNSAKRRFNRAASKRKVSIAISLHTIYQAIHDDNENVASDDFADTETAMDISPEQNNGDIGDPFANVTIQETEKSRSSLFDDNFNPTPFETTTISSSSAWEHISRGNVISDSLIDKHMQTHIMEMNRPASWQAWKVTNTSAGGFRLLWEREESTKAQVGELISIREKEGEEYQWRTGVIRWMQYSESMGLEIGVQLLSPKTLLVTVEEVRNRSANLDYPIHALMLPSIKTVKLPPTLLTPVDQFKLNDYLILDLFHSELHVEINKQGQFSGPFAQFQYRVIA